MTELTLTAFSLPTDLQAVKSPRHVSLFLTTRQMPDGFRTGSRTGLQITLCLETLCLLNCCSLSVTAYDQHLGLQQHNCLGTWQWLEEGVNCNI